MALVRNGDAGDPLPNTRGGSRPPSLVACPSSGRDALAILDPPPNIRGGSRPRSSPKYSRWQSSPEPGRVSLVREGCAGDPNVCGSSPPKSRCVGPRQGRTLRRSSPKYLQCQLSPSQVACPSSGRDLSVVLPKILAVPVVPQVSTRGPRQGGGRRRISPKYMQWQPSPEPRRFSLVREGRSGDPPPNIRAGSRPRSSSKNMRWQSSPKPRCVGPWQGGTRRQSSPKFLRWQSSPSLVACPSSVKDAPTIRPQISAVAVLR